MAFEDRDDDLNLEWERRRRDFEEIERAMNLDANEAPEFFGLSREVNRPETPQSIKDLSLLGTGTHIVDKDPQVVEALEKSESINSVEQEPPEDVEPPELQEPEEPTSPETLPDTEQILPPRPPDQEDEPPPETIPDVEQTLPPRPADPKGSPGWPPGEAGERWRRRKQQDVESEQDAGRRERGRRRRRDGDAEAEKKDQKKDAPGGNAAARAAMQARNRRRASFNPPQQIMVGAGMGPIGWFAGGGDLTTTNYGKALGAAMQGVRQYGGGVPDISSTGPMAQFGSPGTRANIGGGFDQRDGFGVMDEAVDSVDGVMRQWMVILRRFSLLMDQHQDQLRELANRADNDEDGDLFG